MKSSTKMGQSFVEGTVPQISELLTSLAPPTESSAIPLLIVAMKDHPTNFQRSYPGFQDWPILPT